MQGGATSGKGSTAEPVESHHQVLRLEDHPLWNSIGYHGDCTQVCISDYLIAVARQTHCANCLRVTL